jgi:hypothetical protein
VDRVVLALLLGPEDEEVASMAIPAARQHISRMRLRADAVLAGPVGEYGDRPDDYVNYVEEIWLYDWFESQLMTMAYEHPVAVYRFESERQTG